MTNQLRAKQLSLLEVAWRQSDDVFKQIKQEALTIRPIPLRHPFVFYLGHLPAFTWNQLVFFDVEKSLNAEFERLFERGIDPLTQSSAAGARHDTWPDISEIESFRDDIRSRVKESLLSGRFDAIPRVIHGIVEHEYMHIETLLYMVHELDHQFKNQVFEASSQQKKHAHKWCVVPAARVQIGAQRHQYDFVWDNEEMAHEVDVSAIEVSDVPVTNDDYRNFVVDGGYKDPRWWSPESFEWLSEEEICRPVHWLEEGDCIRGLTRNWRFEHASHWPVQVSYAEADAYAKWSSARLMSEAEFNRLATDNAAEGSANFGLRHMGLVNVGSFMPNDLGIYDLWGNAWEWTHTAFAPFPGFSVTLPSYAGYSADFFDGKHRVLLGGSWATADALMRPSFRNWFQERYPYVFAQFRLVRDLT